MNMVDKVARVINKLEGCYEGCNHCKKIACAAIEVMREVPEVCYHNYRCDNIWESMDSRTVWLTWIDAALKE